MKCVMCDNQNKLKSKIIDTHKYKECGLDNVILHGVTVSKCEQCGEEYFNFGNIDKLHLLIASTLIKKDSNLSGKEVRFLRKYLGYSATVFSKLVGYKNEHLSRIENEMSPVQEIFDKLIRYLVLEKMPNRDYSMQDLFLQNKLLHLEWLEFSMAAHEWEVSKAA